MAFSGVSRTGGLGQLGGAAGPNAATMVYAAFGSAWMFLLLAAAAAIAPLMTPFMSSTTRNMLRILK